MVKKLTIKTILYTFLAVLFVICTTAFMRINNAMAEEVFSDSKLFLSEFEKTELSSPQSVDYFDGNYAIYNNSGLIIFSDNTINTIPKTSFTNIDQIKFLSKNVLLVSDFNKVKKIDVLTLEISELKDKDDETITCTRFDTNGNYIITSSGDHGNYRIYSINNGVISSSCTLDGINGTKPICVNSTSIFYVNDSGDGIYCRDIDKIEGQTKIVDVLPDNMIANDEFLFFVSLNKIHAVNLLNNTDSELNVSTENADYELGNISSPSGIALKESNLLVCDTLINAVQEFSISENLETLSFTGFAVAKDKTAYNRFSKNTFEINNYGKKVAVLDDYKLTVIDTSTGFDGYDKKYFANYFIGENIEQFVLGYKGILALKSNVLYYANNTENTPLNLTFNGAIKDMCYALKNYYILTCDGVNTYTYVIDEDNLTISLKNTYEDKLCETFTIDIFGREILFEQAENAVKGISDFVGNLFVLKNDDKLYVKGEEDYQLVDVNFADINSFSFSFDEKRVYYIKNGIDEIFYIDSLNNVAISTLQIESGILTKTAALENIEFYSPKQSDSFNAFAVNIENDSLTFLELTKLESEYILLSKISGTNYCILAGQDNIVLCHENYIKVLDNSIISEEKTVYITTSVRVYFLPIITAENTYVLSLDNTLLAKGQSVSVIGYISFANRTFYLIKYSVGESQVNAYIPSSFTVDCLSKDYLPISYSLEKNISGNVYLEQTLTTVLKEITNETVMVYSVDNNVYYVGIYTESGVINGYMDGGCFINESKISIRNILMVLAVITCISGTATYFILRKKN